MSKRPQHLDYLLSDWAFAPGQVLVRQIQGEDGRDLLQMRIDLGILQMETKGRPDGVMPEGFETFYSHLQRDKASNSITSAAHKSIANSTSIIIAGSVG